MSKEFRLKCNLLFFSDMFDRKKKDSSDFVGQNKQSLCISLHML